MTARKAAHSLQRANGALASGFATVDLHHATGHDRLLMEDMPRNCYAFTVQELDRFGNKRWYFRLG